MHSPLFLDFVSVIALVSSSYSDMETLYCIDRIFYT